ncbi:MAG: hypothetical protein OEZ01_07205 [Candidatus Heimdallarchaeota archaeon]|nr:hypothetical protein [Candidatus Heimdallarchaeota archaeon]MDH5645777.1 hypothetical protein [Candidatus Heimdallarchaeota archaeon]
MNELDEDLLKDLIYNQKIMVLAIINILRVMIVTLTYFITSNSYVVAFIGREFSVIDKILSISFISIKITLAVGIEIFFSTRWDSNENLSSNSISRLFQFSISMLIAEILFFIIVRYTIIETQDINFLKLQLTDQSMLTFVVNGYTNYILPVVIFYTIAMIILIYPRNDINQKRMETISIIMFIRTILLPI